MPHLPETGIESDLKLATCAILDVALLRVALPAIRLGRRADPVHRRIELRPAGVALGDLRYECSRRTAVGRGLIGNRLQEAAVCGHLDIGIDILSALPGVQPPRPICLGTGDATCGFRPRCFDPIVERPFSRVERGREALLPQGRRRRGEAVPDRDTRDVKALRRCRALARLLLWCGRIARMTARGQHQHAYREIVPYPHRVASTVGGGLPLRHRLRFRGDAGGEPDA